MNRLVNGPWDMEPVSLRDWVSVSAPGRPGPGDVTVMRHGHGDGAEEVDLIVVESEERALRVGLVILGTAALACLALGFLLGATLF